MSRRSRSLAGPNRAGFGAHHPAQPQMPSAHDSGASVSTPIFSITNALALDEFIPRGGHGLEPSLGIGPGLHVLGDAPGVRLQGADEPVFSARPTCARCCWPRSWAARAVRAPTRRRPPGAAPCKKGAAFLPMLAFMFASTNLVIELGAVLWIVMGWRFVLAEAVGSFVLIGFVWLLGRLVFPKDIGQEARRARRARGRRGRGLLPWRRPRTPSPQPRRHREHR